MTRVPMGSSTANGPGVPFGPRMLKRYDNGLVHQGISADLIAHKWEISREELDAYQPGEPPQGRASHRRGPLPQPDRSRRGDERGRHDQHLRQRRGHPHRYKHGEAGEPQTLLQARWIDYRRQLFADQRRRGSRADHGARDRRAAGAAATRALRLLCRWSGPTPSSC